jgi:hypothetical protein
LSIAINWSLRSGSDMKPRKITACIGPAATPAHHPALRQPFVMTLRNRCRGWSERLGLQRAHDPGFALSTENRQRQRHQQADSSGAHRALPRMAMKRPATAGLRRPRMCARRRRL